MRKNDMKICERGFRRKIVVVCISVIHTIIFNHKIFSQSWKNVNLQGMGFVTGLRIHPTSGDIYVRTDAAGVFRWDGTKWNGLMDKLSLFNVTATFFSVESFAIDENTSGSSQVIFAAVGDNINDATYPTPRMLRSTDNGNTWTNLTGFPGSTIEMGGNQHWRHAGERLAIDPATTGANRVIYFGTRNDGLWKSTDNGNTWSQVASGTFPSNSGGTGNSGARGGISFVVFDPSTDPSNRTVVSGQTVTKNIYVGVIDGGSPSRGVYRSSDGGSTWSSIGTIAKNPVRAVFNNGRLYIACNDNYTSPWGETGGDGRIYLYDPATNTLTDKTPPTSCPMWVTYSWTGIAVHPTNPNFVVVTPHNVTTQKIFYTTNFLSGSPTWRVWADSSDLNSPCGTGTGYSVCATQAGCNTVDNPDWNNMQHYYSWGADAQFNPQNPNQVYFTNGHAVYRINNVTTQNTTTSSEGIMLGLEESCSQQLIAPPGATRNLVIASQDLLGIRVGSNPDAIPPTKINPPGATGTYNGWQGNGRSIAYCYNNPSHIVIVGAKAGGIWNTRVALKSTDGGATWSNLNTFDNQGSGCTKVATCGNIAMSSTNPNLILWAPHFDNYPSCSGYSSIKTHPHRSTDGGATWSQMNDISFTNGNQALSDEFSSGQVLESDKVNGNKFYYYVKRNGDSNFPPASGATWQDQFWITTNGGASWSLQCTDCFGEVTNATFVKAMPGCEGYVWVGHHDRFKYGGANERRLYRSTNDGATFVNVLATGDEVYNFAFGAPFSGTPSVANPPVLYIYGKIGGTEGIYYCENPLATAGSLTFTSLTTTSSPPLGIIHFMEADKHTPKRVYVATSCRGTWYLDFAPLSLDESESRWTRFNDDLNKSNNVSIYPSVVHDVLNVNVNISTDTNNVTRVLIYDVVGNLVYSKEVNHTNTRLIEISEVSKLSPGLYIVKVHYDKQTYAQKIIKE